MANTTVGLVWKIDNASNALITGEVVYVKSITWFNPATIGHLFTVTDESDNVIAKGRCEAANKPVDIPVGTRARGLKVTAGGGTFSGELYLYLTRPDAAN